MASFKSSNELRVEIGYDRGRLVPRHVYRGDTEVQVKEMTQSKDGLAFTVDLGAELAAPIAPLPPDEAAAAALSDAEKTAIHQKAVDAKVAAEKAASASAKSEVEIAPETAKAGEKGSTSDKKDGK